LLEWLPSRTQTTNVGKDVGVKEPSYMAVNVNYYKPTMENMEAPLKTETRAAI
jgi:hypothetical protein